MSKFGLAGLLAAVLSLANPAAAADDPLDELAAQAEKNGSIIWYESSPVDRIAKVVEVFNRRFPKLKVEHLRDTGGGSIAARIVQEVQGGGRPADVATSGMSMANPLQKRGLLQETDWAALGVDKSIPQSRYAVLTASGFYVFVYNTGMVKESEAPKAWEDLLDPKWKKKIGSWSRPMMFVSLEPKWGQRKTEDYVRRFSDQEPFFQKSTFPVAQQVAAGETPVAIGMYHSTLPTKEKGAPIAIVIPDPVPVSPVYSFVVSKARNVAGGQLLAAWLTTPEGARAYEEATGRGNEGVPGTQTHRLLVGKTLSNYPLTDADAENAATVRLQKLLRTPAGM